MAYSSNTNSLSGCSLLPWLFAAIDIASAVYLIVLGFFAPLSLDDYGFVSDVDKYGPLSFAIETYRVWSGRFTGYLVCGVWCSLFGRMPNLLPGVIALLVLGCLCFTPLVAKVTSRRGVMAFFVALALVSVAIISIPDLQTAYWLCTQPYIISCFVSVSLFYGLYGMSRKRLSWVLVLTMSVLLMCNSEVYTPTLLAGIVFCLFGELLKKNNKNRTRLHQLLTVAVLLAIGFVIIILSPGNATRLSSIEASYYADLSSFNLWKYLIATLKASVILVFRSILNTAYLFLLFPVFALLGKEMQNAGREVKLLPFKESLIITGLSLFVAVVVFTAVCVFGVGWYAPLRSYSFFSFLLAFIIAYWGLWTGNALSRRGAVVIKITSVVATLVICAGLCFKLHNEYPRVSKYKSDVSQMTAAIQAGVESSRQDPLVVAPIEPQTVPSRYTKVRNCLNVIIGSSSRIDEQYFPYPPIVLSVNPDDWKNTMLRDYYSASFPIIGWEE